MKLLAVDANSILNRAYYGVRPLTTRDGRFTHAIFGFLNILFKALDEVAPDCVAFAFDLKAPTFRHEMYDGYKAQRKGMPPELAEQLSPLKEILTAMGYPILQLEGYEADDILGTLACLCREAGEQCVIMTGDRDSFQLVSDTVSVRLASSKNGASFAEMIDAAAILERYGLTPQQLIDVKALMGDSSDNIPGVAGVGEKTALSLIGQFGSLDSLYERIDDPAIKDGVRKKLTEHRDMAFLSRTLAKIDCNVPLGRTLGELATQPREDAALYALLESLELKTILTRLALTSQPRQNAPAEHTLLGEKVEFSTACGNDVEMFSSERIFVQLLTQSQKLSSVLLLSDKLYYFDANFDKVFNSIISNSEKLVVPDSKTFYHLAAGADKSSALVAFDFSLAGYVLSPLSSDYSVDALCAGREVSVLQCDLPELPEEVQSAASALLRMPDLWRQLSEEIERNNQHQLLYEVELPLARVLASMESLGFALDREGLVRYGKELDDDLSELCERIYQLAGGQFNLNSPKQLGEVLFDRLGLPAKKKTKTGYSTNAEVLDSLKFAHPIVEDILSYRTLSKLKSTYVEGLLAAVGPDGRIRSSFRQTETRTGRISSTEPNLQNIPIRTERGSLLRRFFVAKEGALLVDADYSQIELRVLAHIAGDERMIDAFRNNEDIHTKTAAQVFDMPEAFVTKQMRSAAKAVNFGIVYGIGAFSLSQDINVSVAEADKYIKNYLATYPKVKQYMEDTIAFAKEHGYVKTQFERRRPIPELAATNKITRSFGERVAMNTPIQGTAADIIKIAMVRVHDALAREKFEARLILQVHDELIVEAPAHEADRVRALLLREMEGAYVMSAALRADAGVGKNWLDAK